MDNQRELEYIKNYKPSVDDLRMKPWMGLVKSDNNMEPAATIGRIVIFNVPEDMKPKVNHADKLPAVIVRVWSNNVVNLKIITDGFEDIWQTSVPFGTDVNQWEWPERR